MGRQAAAAGELQQDTCRCKRRTTGCARPCDSQVAAVAERRRGEEGGGEGRQEVTRCCRVAREPQQRRASIAACDVRAAERGGRQTHGSAPRAHLSERRGAKARAGDVEARDLTSHRLSDNRTWQAEENLRAAELKLAEASRRELVFKEESRKVKP
eukprot:762465-Hanusia_phi.AAC.2